MRKLFLLSVVALLSVSLFAQQKKMVEFDKSIHDFGKIVEGQGNGGKVTAVFKFTNICLYGKQPRRGYSADVCAVLVLRCRR